MKATVRKVGGWWEVRLPHATYRDRSMFHDTWGRRLADENPYCFRTWGGAMSFVANIAAIYYTGPA